MGLQGLAHTLTSSVTGCGTLIPTPPLGRDITPVRWCTDAEALQEAKNTPRSWAISPSLKGDLNSTAVSTTVSYWHGRSSHPTSLPEIFQRFPSTAQHSRLFLLNPQSLDSLHIGPRLQTANEWKLSCTSQVLSHFSVFAPAVSPTGAPTE